MKIKESEKINGAAIAQIIKQQDGTIVIASGGGGAFIISARTGILCKHATKPGNGAYDFSFDPKTMRQLRGFKNDAALEPLYFLLICICPDIQEVCALSYELLLALIEEGDHSPSKQHTIRVETGERRSFAVSIRTRNDPQRLRKKIPVIFSLDVCSNRNSKFMNRLHWPSTNRPTDAASPLM